MVFCERTYKDIQEKIKQTYFKESGFYYPGQIKNIKEKSKQTCLEKYGVDVPYKSKLIREKGKQTCLKKYGVDCFSKTEQGRLIIRKAHIKKVENQRLNGEPLSPRIGEQERLCLNKLQNHTFYNILRNDNSFRYIIGRFPDGHIPELKLFIQFDEKDHFVDKECKIYNQDDDSCTLQLASLGYIIFRVSEIEWVKEQKKIINLFQILLKELKYA